MVQSFSTSDSAHRFTVDGAGYRLSAIDAPDIEVIGRFADLKPQDAAVEMREFLAQRAVADRGPFLRWLTGQKAPRAAVESLALAQTAELFKAWASGVGSPGESSSSADSQ
jgi:hypothetical protein